MCMQLDEIDAKILFHLQKNAKIPIKEISWRIHLSQSATLARIKNLEENQYIQHYAAVLNKSKLNKKLISFTGLQLRAHAQDNLISSSRLISEFPEVINCYIVNGGFDFLLHIAVADMQEYNSFYLNALLKIKNIETVRTFFVIDELKDDNSVDLSNLFKMYSGKSLRLD
ncbi:regulatory protein AsnC/Lrp family [Pedobacter heparinus DSM 2366]|uniref:Regulatory protein AsnC/Lrp family n=2 Tax=Sphingobacteriaceae TaxID=84566 RepID=C6XS51_PEDHD|nr:regulatory protein AsnC/Lrp family [Pedobacter heparinus DSM 2366]